MAALLSRLRRQSRQFVDSQSPTATRYPAVFRREVAEYARSHIARGGVVAGVARDLGLRPRTLRLWLRPQSARTLRRVRLVAAQVEGTPTPGVKVTTATGLCVEGLDVESAARLVRLLG
jgi:hypothetical protein